MKERGLIPEFPEQVLEELASINAPATPKKAELFRDMRNLLWVSIDNDDSRDLDQLTFAKENKIFVAVADVDALVKKGSALDHYAGHNTTSVYTPAKVFPMLPLKLSTDLTSLNVHCDRCAIVIEMEIDAEGGFELVEIHPALVRNKAKLAYNAVAGWLEEDIRLPKFDEDVHEQLKLQDSIAERIRQYRKHQGALGFKTIELQAVVVYREGLKNREVPRRRPEFESGEAVAEAAKLKKFSDAGGSQSLRLSDAGRTDSSITSGITGIAVKLQKTVDNRAHRVIENYMIAANVCVTKYLSEWNLPTLRRVVKVPKRWWRIVQLAKDLGEHLPSHPNVRALRDFLEKQEHAHPEQFYDLSLAIIKLIGRGEYVIGLPDETNLSHFDLALREYAHTTAPNRRYPDLIMQRLLKSQLYGEAIHYTHKELAAIARQCTEKESAASKVERQLIKCAAAMILANQVGQVFHAMVTGASPKGTWVRLKDPPVEGRLTHGHEEVDVGDHLKVQLIRVDVRNGHLDFSRVNG